MIGLAAAAVVSVLAAPVSAGPASSSEVPAAVTLAASPVGGAWMQVIAPNEEERLLRVDEDGLAAPVETPAELRGEGLEVTPLPSGWLVGADRYWPGGLEERIACQPAGTGSDNSSELPGSRATLARQHGCSELVVAQLDPAGHWTAVQTLPHSFTAESGASAALESHGTTELVWGEGELARDYVSSARLGHLFTHPHVVRDVYGSETQSPWVLVHHSAISVRAEFARQPPRQPTPFWVERELHADGTLGPTRFVRGTSLEEGGASLEGDDESESWLYGGYSHALLYAYRSRGAPVFERPRVIEKAVVAEDSTQSANHRSLVSMLALASHDRAQVATAEISPSGRLGPVRRVELLPGGLEEGATWGSAIDDAASTLVVTAGGPPGPLWAYASSPRCPGYRAKTLLTAETNGHAPAVSAGRDGVFHVAWVEANEARLATVRVACQTR